MTRTIMRIMGATLLAEVPFAMLVPHEQQALFNHRQSLDRLASRGGLSAVEALDIIEGRRWASSSPGIDTEQRLINKVRAWRAAQGESKGGA